VRGNTLTQSVYAVPFVVQIGRRLLLCELPSAYLTHNHTRQEDAVKIADFAPGSATW